MRLAVWVGLFLCPGVGPLIVFGPLVGWIVGALGLVLLVVGYDDDNDKAARVRLLKWDANKEFDFSSYDHSFGVSVDSPGAAAIKQDLAARIGDASYFL